MCKDNQQSKENKKTITYDIWRKLIDHIYFNCHALATSAKILLKQNITENEKWNVNDPPYVAAGLYTYAVEEYGKILFLLEKKPSNYENITINYKKFLDHQHKFRRALEKLPNECKKLHTGGFSNSGFTSSGFNTDTIADFEARKAIFYTDFDSDKVKELPEVNSKKLDVALNKFIYIIETELEDFHKTFQIR